MHTRSIFLGGLTWLSLAVGGAIAVRSQFAEKENGFLDVASGIRRWVCGVPQEHLATAAVEVVMAPGDPVFLKKPDGTYRQVGRVRNNFASTAAGLSTQVRPTSEAWTTKASIILYDDVIDSVYPDGYQLEHHTAPTSLDWVARTLVPPERQKQIARIIATDWQKHRDEVLLRLQPVIENSIARSVVAIEAELPAAMNAQRADFAKVAERYQTEVIRSQIVPLVREEILPIVEEEVRPLAVELGKELWDRVSLWSFTWRYLYDVSPLPEKNAVKREFDRFMTSEVTPALESRSEQFVEVTERILRRISRNEKVRSVVRENLKKAVSDSELQAIVWAVVQQSVINNETLKTSLRDYWSSSEVQGAMQVATSRFEPTARAIGDSIFGNRESGITPEFSRVMRMQILMKDRRWLIVAPKSATNQPGPVAPTTGLAIVPAAQPMDFPLDFEGQEQSPLTHLNNANQATNNVSQPGSSANSR